MEKLSMCRICLVEDVRMLVVSNKNLQDIYETLTNIPLVTEDRRPILACYFCYSKLKQCDQFKRKCLKAEELFAQMLNSCEQKPFIIQGNSEPVGGLVKTSVENINIFDVGAAIEVEVPIVPAMPADSKTPYEFIEVKVEHQSDDEPEDNSYRDVDHVSVRHSRTDSEDDVPLLRIKTEVPDLGEQHPQVSRNVRRADAPHRAPVMKKPKLEDKFTAEQMKTEKQGSNIFQTTSDHTMRSKIIKNITTDSDGVNKHETNKEKPHKCDMCHRSYTVKSHLTDHKRKHTGERPFECDICHRSFSVKSHLTDHKRKHTGEKPYECEICHRCFAVSRNLKPHIRTHTGAAKPFKCDICQRSFTLKNNLRTHALVHTGEKPYKCHICERAFTQKIHLQSHIPIHTGDKPFKCDVCERSFSLKHTLVRHIQVLHDGKKYVPGKSERVTRSIKSEESQTSGFSINKST